MKKIIMMITIALLIVGCSAKKEEEPVITSGKVNYTIYYHNFGEVNDHMNSYLIASVFTFNQDVDTKKVTIQMEGCDEIGTVNETLTGDKEYTSDYLKDKVHFEKLKKHVVKYVIIDTTKDELDMNDMDAISAKIAYEGEYACEVQAGVWGHLN